MASSDTDTAVEIATGRPMQDRRAESPASMQVAVDLGAATHVGLVRANNEDSYLISRAERSLQTLLTSLPAGNVPAKAAEQSYGLAVADGMGGQAAGEVASRIALRAIVEHVIATADWIMRDTTVENLERIEGRMSERFEAANQAVQEQARQHPRWDGMGTTLTLAVSCGDQLFLGHVGDSRAYLLRSGQLQVLTRDHSYAQVFAVDVRLVPASDAYGYYTDEGTGSIAIPVLSLIRFVDLYRGEYTSLADVLRHEYGHALADNHRGLFRSSRFRRTFGASHEDESQFEYDPDFHVPEYASTDASEDFAESFMLYLRHNGGLPAWHQTPVKRAKWRFIRQACRAVKSGRGRW